MSKSPFEVEAESVLLNYRASLNNNFATNSESLDQALTALTSLHLRLVGEVIGEAPKPFINGKYPDRGDTVQVDLENNYIEGLKFVQDNGAYTLWDKQRKRAGL